MIIDGIGLFGNAVLTHFTRTTFDEIRVLLWEEKKQGNMRYECQIKYLEVAHKIKCNIGNVQCKSILKSSERGVDYVFHVAALKPVPSCKFFPIEAVKTKVIGADSVLDAAASSQWIRLHRTNL